MLSRRRFAVATGLFAAKPMSPQGCSPSGEAGDYEEAAASIWRPLAHDLTSGALLRRELVRYATLAPVVKQTGTPEMARGELLRFLPEMAWHPNALLPSQGVRWDAVDDTSARATLTDSKRAVTLLCFALMPTASWTP